MARLDVALEGRVVRTAPPVLGVLPVPERVERLLPAGRGDVEALARLQVHAGREDMDMDRAARLGVLHGRPGVTVGRQARPSGLLELVQNGLDLGGGRRIVGRPGHHARGVGVGEIQAVGDLRDERRIAPQDGDAGPFHTLGVCGRGQVGGR